MYKPIYFDGGQAIHGANTVPTSPQSHGVRRLRLEHQDVLIAWLGLGDLARADVQRQTASTCGSTHPQAPTSNDLTGTAHAPPPMSSRRGRQS